MTVAGLVLAAGAGRRFGSPKAVAVIDGERLVDRAVRLVRSGGCAPVIVVAGAVPLDVVGAYVVDNPQWATGMGSSLRAGLTAARQSDASAVVVALVDTPWVGSEAVRRLRAAHARGAAIAVATYGGRIGHPVLLGRETWDEVERLAIADVGARGLIAHRPDLVVEVPCDGTGDPRDVDIPAELAANPGASPPDASARA